MTLSNRFIARAIAIFISLTAMTLRAGEVTTFTWHPGVASLAATSISPLSAPNNNDVAGDSPNTIWVTQKNYIAIGPVDITFDVINSGGVSEYSVAEGVYNGTGLNWSGYHVELGFGFGVGFVKSTAGDGLDFDAPEFNSLISFNPSPGFFPSYTTPTEDDLVAGGGVMPYLSFAGNFRFSIDVPDGITQFTLRQSPIGVPEPSSLVGCAIGLVGLVVVARRKSIAV